MAVTILDDDERQETEEVSSLDELNETPVEQKQPQEEPQEEDEIPEKYQGKSVKEIIQMHKEAEKLLGRQSSEVGELRKVVDGYIQSQLTNKAPDETEEIDFFDNPKEAVSKAIENHPKVREAEQASWEYKKQASLAEMQRRHPDVMDVVRDDNFMDWVKASKIRTQLLIQADQQFDVEAGDELLTTWKERQSVAKKTAEVEKQSRKEQVKQAATGNVRGSGESARKIYRRSDIIKLMKEDPDRYQALSDEIMKAYAEGRVK